MSRYGRDTVELELKLHSSNQAFVDAPVLETVRILRELADDIAETVHGYCEGDLVDANGNRVGSFEFRVTEDAEGAWE